MNSNNQYNNNISNFYGKSHMHIFYSTETDNNTFILNEEESRHLSRVLRLKEGDNVQIINGSGTLYEGRITDLTGKQAKVEIVNKVKDYNCKNYYLHIAIAPTKSMDRFEWFVEKSVEFGIDEITPLVCDHSERRIIKTERVKKIIISAMKQSVKAKEPVINPAVEFGNFFTRDLPQNRFIAHCSIYGNTYGLNNVYKPGTDTIILIGPEGDFSSAEVAVAEQHNFIPVNLGKSRLRTETAGVAVCSLIYFQNQ